MPVAAMIVWPASTVEYVPVQWAADVTLDTQAVQIAMIPDGGDPTDADWHVAFWDGSPGMTRTAKWLYAAALPPGRYAIFSRLTDTPEIPVRPAGLIQLV